MFTKIKQYVIYYLTEGFRIMDIKDIVALAKAGYKPNDIKELLELCDTKPGASDASIDDLKSKANESNTSEKKTETGAAPVETENAFEKLAKGEI